MHVWDMVIQWLDLRLVIKKSDYWLFVHKQQVVISYKTSLSRTKLCH